jgi:hypothetical protein
MKTNATGSPTSHYRTGRYDPRKTKAAEREASQRRAEDPTARQRKKRTAKTFIDSDDMWNLHLKLDAETVARAEARIKAINKQMWHQDKAGGPDADRTPQQRFADAAAQTILEQHAASRDSQTPALRPTPDVTVAIPIDWLMDQANDQKISLTNTGIPLSAAAIRRLACDANIIPIILGSAGEILDQGRNVRTATKAQRRALELRDSGRLWPRCNAPPSDFDVTTSNTGSTEATATSTTSACSAGHSTASSMRAATNSGNSPTGQASLSTTQVGTLGAPPKTDISKSLLRNRRASLSEDINETEMAPETTTPA